MAGGLDKQIYLPYQLAQQLGFYKKYGVNVGHSTEQDGGVGADGLRGRRTWRAPGTTTPSSSRPRKAVEDVVQPPGAPGEREMWHPKKSGVTLGADFKGKTLGVTDLGSEPTLSPVPGRQEGRQDQRLPPDRGRCGSTAIAA
ncbi:hypothetical protein SALBM311S_06133 [Streptomyces alboniger]